MSPGPLPFAACLLAVAACSPAPEDPAPPQARYMSSSNPWSKDYVAADPSPAPAARRSETALPRRGDGHFYAHVVVDGQPTEMLVDTGASVIALTGEDARALGISWNSSDIQPVARGAGGTVHGLPVRLDRVELGGIEVRDVQAVVVPDGLPVSLLGQSFLGRVGRVEISGDRMVLGG